MDLLTVLLHEIGHLLGAAHDHSGVMTPSLAAGTRVASAADLSREVDHFFGGDGLEDHWLAAAAIDQLAAR